MPRRLVLASASPRRRHLLEEAGLHFEVVVPSAAELSSGALTIRELTTCNATRKAVAVARGDRRAVVLGADTLVALEGQSIGKPPTLREAGRILRRLSGRQHQVCTAVFICCLATRTQLGFHVVSQVRFRTLSDELIADYLAKVDPLDKAGGYAAQGQGSEIIERIRGSYTNVVGLPMGETLHALRSFGIGPRPGTRAGNQGATR